jgi:3-hydroxy-D-aspartate aldolase
MSHAKADKAICDAGLKAQSVDSGLPVVFGRDDVNTSNARTSMA